MTCRKYNLQNCFESLTQGSELKGFLWLHFYVKIKFIILFINSYTLFPNWKYYYFLFFFLFLVKRKENKLIRKFLNFFTLKIGGVVGMSTCFSSRNNGSNHTRVHTYLFFYQILLHNMCRTKMCAEYNSAQVFKCADQNSAKHSITLKVYL